MLDNASFNKSFFLIMAGGKGTRFWPESTEKKPKQYLNLLGRGSLLEQTVSRLEGLIPLEDTFVVTVKDQEELATKSTINTLLNSRTIGQPRSIALSNSAWYLITSS